MRFLVLLSLAAWVPLVAGVSLRGQASVNPVRKVVNMLQAMQKKVMEEGVTEKTLYDKFVCYCKTGGSDLSSSISAAKARLGDLGTDILAAESKLSQTDQALEEATTSREAGAKAMAEASALRAKEANTYAKFKADSNANSAAVYKAITSIEGGMAGGFLQTSAASVLRQIVSDSHQMDDPDRQMMVSFLSGSNSYAPQSGQIVGILKTMLDEMSAGFADATSTEEAAINTFKSLMDSKLKEKAALTESIQAKLVKVGELGVSIAEMKNDAGDTGDALSADTKFLAELEKGCSTKSVEWEARSKTRAQELVALSDTIKILNDDDALELFKKTLPSASSSFVQVQGSAALLRTNALIAIRRSQYQASPVQRVRLDLIALALHGKKIGFDKIITMIDNMLVTLKKEQVDDDSKKAYCAAQLDESDDKKRRLERKASNLDKSIATVQDALSTFTEEIAALEQGISKLDISVAEATANRKSEHVEYNELIASSSAAQEVLNMAKNRMQTFYNPKLAKPVAAVVPALVQVLSHRHLEAPPPPPETFNAYVKKSEEDGGVVQMINLLIADLAKQMTEGETAEKDAQVDYELLMQDAAEKRTADSKSLSEKQAAKADAEASLEGHNDDKVETARVLGATNKYIYDLHLDCDWLVKYYDVRRQARADEVDSLGNAKAVLSGASFSLSQTNLEH